MNCIRNWNLKNGLETMKIKKYNDIDAEGEVDDDDDDEELISNCTYTMASNEMRIHSRIGSFV